MNLDMLPNYSEEKLVECVCVLDFNIGMHLPEASSRYQGYCLATHQLLSNEHISSIWEFHFWEFLDLPWECFYLDLSYPYHMGRKNSSHQSPANAKNHRPNRYGRLIFCFWIAWKAVSYNLNHFEKTEMKREQTFGKLFCNCLMAGDWILK